MKEIKQYDNEVTDLVMQKLEPLVRDYLGTCDDNTVVDSLSSIRKAISHENDAYLICKNLLGDPSFMNIWDPDEVCELMKCGVAHLRYEAFKSLKEKKNMKGTTKEISLADEKSWQDATGAVSPADAKKLRELFKKQQDKDTAEIAKLKKNISFVCSCCGKTADAVWHSRHCIDCETRQNKSQQALSSQNTSVVHALQLCVEVLAKLPLERHDYRRAYDAAFDILNSEKQLRK